MPWKLIVLIIIMIVAIVFVGFNMDNRGDISLVVKTLKDVPVTLTTLTAYVLGLITALALVLGKNRKQKEKDAEAEPLVGEDGEALEAHHGDDSSISGQDEEADKKNFLSGLLKKKK